MPPGSGLSSTTTSRGARCARVIDMVVIGKGRTEITLILTTRYADRAQADIAEQAMAKLLLRRVAA